MLRKQSLPQLNSSLQKRFFQDNYKGLHWEYFEPEVVHLKKRWVPDYTCASCAYFFKNLRDFSRTIIRGEQKTVHCYLVWAMSKKWNQKSKSIELFINWRPEVWGKPGTIEIFPCHTILHCHSWKRPANHTYKITKSSTIIRNPNLSRSKAEYVASTFKQLTLLDSEVTT